MLSPIKNKSGYTLIEILVAMTIIGLIFSVGYVSYRDFARRQALEGSARRLEADLRLAQEQSLAGKKPTAIACSGEGALNGYDFYAETASSYVIQANCTGGLVDIKTVQMAEEVTLTSNPSRFTFKVLGSGTDLSTTADVTLTQTATGNTFNITVSPEGEIK
jgi:prepilin-type N-terminal cleavage/methylation domain-containing protein